jgi:phage gp36-like protein
MPYITQTEFEKRFGESELANLTESTDFNAAAADATSLIDGYLASRYTLPLSTVPPMVQSWAADVARYRLWDDRAPEEVRKRYEDVLQQLGQLARGLFSLPPGSDGAKPAGGGIAFGGYCADRVFTSDTLAGF